MNIEYYLRKYNNSLKILFESLNFNSSFEDFIDSLLKELHINNIISESDFCLFTNKFLNKFSYKKDHVKYICPGCLYYNKYSIINLDKYSFLCQECRKSFENTNDPKDKFLFETFMIHNKSGYKCPDCLRFIPKPLNLYKDITCPYIDCCFVGKPKRKENHPILNSIKIINISSNKEENYLFKIIEDLKNKECYNGSDFTIKFRLTAFQAIENLLKKYPSEMTDYLVNQSRKGGFQNKIFKEYIFLLEKELPFCFIKNKKIYRVDSLLDQNISIFDGISFFESIIDDKLQIKNNTKEFYIGGRKASYSKQFYIGKLINVVDKNTKQSLMSYVKDYSFSKIYMKDISSNKEVIVTHFRVYPHYQMGAMSYINRIRKLIVDEILNEK